MAPAFSKLATVPNTAIVLGALSAGLLLLSSVKKGRQPKKSKIGDDRTEAVLHAAAATKEKKAKAVVNLQFFRNLRTILKILIPKLVCKETGYLILVAIMLVSRTYCDVWMIQNSTMVESSIIGRNYEAFKSNLKKFAIAMPLISIVNNVLKYGLNKTKLAFRKKLTEHLYSKYLQDFTFYKMVNVDNRIANPDQLLTQDVDKFCEITTQLYSNLSKPMLDVVIYSISLSGSIGAQGPITMLLYLVASGIILTWLRRPVGKMTVIEQRYEGEFRYVNSRLLTNSEEIAFYCGNHREKVSIMNTFYRLVGHLKKFIMFRFSMGFLDNIIAKYLATVVGFYVVSRPFLDPTNALLAEMTHSQCLEHYYQSGRMLIRMAESIGRIVLSGRELTRLSGFTARIVELIAVLKDLNEGKYERTMLSSSAVEGSSEVLDVPLAPGSGRIVEQDNVIKFKDVPLVTPNGDMLIRSLNFEVQSGVNVLVCGPNGCGKSSLFRIVGELWPLFGGTLTKPAAGKLFYVPQRPYMTIGTFRDQVIYPDTIDDQSRRGTGDSDLEDILDKVQLKYLLDREGGWESIQDWMDVLSGGEKQRIAMARIFYHRPQFAILDECTSAVSVDVEGFIYSYCRKLGITLFTVSHRKSLWQHHEYVLKMDGRGNYSFKPITDETEEFGS